MGPPGGGRNLITSRFIRHFMIISMQENDEKSLQRIFGTLMKWYLAKHDYEMDSDVANTFQLAVNTSIYVYE